MKALLTYALAALSAACIGILLQNAATDSLLEPFVLGAQSGDPRLLAGAIAGLLVQWLVAFVVILIFGGAVWFVAFRLLSRAARRLPLPGYAALGAVVMAAVVVSLGVASHLSLLYEFGIPPGTQTGNSLVWQMVILIAPHWAAAGVAWGAVFWLRGRAKPSTQLSAAE